MHDSSVLQQVADLHVDNLEQGFLATLGPRFLALMYRAIDESESAVLLVAMRNGRAIGFVAGSLGMGPVYAGMRRHWFQLIAALFPSLFNPRRLWRIFEILRYSHKIGAQADLPGYELLSLAVDPAARGQGVSEGLYTGLVNHCRERGIPAFKIVVGEQLVPARRFYQRMGAVVVAKTEVHRDQKSFIYMQVVD